jgi:hypothetical protein
VERVRQSLEMMPEDLIDHVDVVEDPQEHRRILRRDPLDVSRDHLAEAAVRPPLEANELRIGM